jgi:lysophospholipase L1-like esterase
LTTNAARRGRSFLPNPLLVLGTTILLVPFAEIVVRLVRPQTLPSQEFLRGFVLKDMYVPDDRAGYRLAPGFSGRIERNGVVTEFATSSLGLRAAELGPKDGTRILALGDSFTWGWGVPQGEEWISVTGRKLNEALGRDAVETVNGGVNGYGTENALALLERIGPEVSPDLVLLGFFANDYTDNFFGAKGIYTVRDGYLFDHFSHAYFEENFLARESHLYRLLHAAWETFRVNHLGGLPGARALRQFSAAEFEEGRVRSEELILRMREECARLGARFAVVWLPADVYALRGTRPEDILLRVELQERVAAAGIPSLDLLSVVAREPRIGGLYLPNDGHFSSRGNAVAGRAVAKWIREEGLLDPVPVAIDGTGG